MKRITEALFFQYGNPFTDEMLNSIIDETFHYLHLCAFFLPCHRRENDQCIDFDTFCRIPNIGDPIIQLPSILEEWHCLFQTR